MSWGVSSRGCASSVPFWGRRGMRWLCCAKSKVLVCWGLAQDARGRRCQGDPRLIIQPLAGQVTAGGGRGGPCVRPLPPAWGGRAGRRCRCHAGSTLSPTMCPVLTADEASANGDKPGSTLGALFLPPWVLASWPLGQQPRELGWPRHGCRSQELCLGCKHAQMKLQPPDFLGNAARGAPGPLHPQSQQVWPYGVAAAS